MQLLRIRQFLWDMWGATRHILALRGLLQWTGYWETAVALITSLFLAAWYWVSQNSVPITILIFLATFLVVSLIYRTIVDMNFIWPLVTIDNPYQDDFVEFKKTVYGHIYPSRRRVQVWVFSGDGKYYNQRGITRNQARWAVNCQFGNQTSPGGSYEIVVASVKTEIVATPLDKLPDVVHPIKIGARRK
jgi:hypothetical protein